MKGTYVISPEVVDWVIDQIGSDPKPLNALQILNEWKSETRTPTFNEIKRVSKKTRIPLGYFFLQRPPTETIRLMEYRTIANAEFDTPSRELVDTINDMENIVDWTRSYLESNHYEPNPIVGMCKDQSDSSAIADTVRRLLGLSINWFELADNPFNYLRTKMSENGVIVMMNGIVRENTHRRLNINEFRAFTIIDEFAPLIFINAADSLNGRLFSLLHEFVHVCLGSNNLYNDRYPEHTTATIEMLCNAASAEILVPSSLFTDVWEIHASSKLPIADIVKMVAKTFKCSQVVIARRAYDEKKISRKHYDDIVKIAIERFRIASRTKKDGGHYYNTKASRIDRRFFSFIVDSVAQGTTLYSEAFRLTSTNRHTFFELVERLN